MKSHSNNSRLYVTKDRHKEGVYFAKTDVIKFCRFQQTPYGWELWFYPWKIRKRAPTLTETTKLIEKYFKIYWEETYAVHN